MISAIFPWLPLIGVAAVSVGVTALVAGAVIQGREQRANDVIYERLLPDPFKARMREAFPGTAVQEHAEALDELEARMRDLERARRGLEGL